MTEQRDIEYVAAVFVDRSTAEAAVAELRSLGMANEHLGVAVHDPDQRVFEDDVERDEMVAIEEGALVGLPVGVLAGMGIMAVALPGIGTVAVGGLLAAGGAAGALIGAFLGGLVGVASADSELEERRVWEEYQLQPGDILVVARSHHHPTLVREVLQKHGGHHVEHRPGSE
ncbi:MAG: hypothetical protein QNL12_14495 [Acidimicrobiia bacterium]|nr:hypothetical protein [Acidimicrobiia bacterium]MDX2468525.1 hypothetical protein [Acidimicrobiia bacterium]